MKIFDILVQMDPKFLRNQRYAKKHNLVAAVEEEEEETQMSGSWQKLFGVSAFQIWELLTPGFT